MSASSARLHAIVTGIVQGVNFRWFTKRHATALSLTGYVRNCPDGSVEIVAEGPREALERLLAFVREGPPSAVVDKVEVEWSAPSGAFAYFEIRYA